MAYKFTIETAEEFESLKWIAARYEYADELLKALKACWMRDDAGKDFGSPITFDLQEHEAWNVQRAVENEDGYLSCMGGRLKGEVEKLLDSIV